MKNLFKLFAGIFICSILFFSCDKEETKKSGNYLKIGDTEYELSTGILENYGNYYDSDINSNNIDLTLLSSDFTVTEVDGVIESISGTGHFIYFELYTSQTDKLDIGSYIYDSEDSYESGTYDYAFCILNYDTQTESGTSASSITSGTLTVTDNSDEYEITFDNNELGISLYYKGSLNYYDYDYSKSLNLNKTKRFN